MSLARAGDRSHALHLLEVSMRRSFSRAVAAAIVTAIVPTFVLVSCLSSHVNRELDGGSTATDAPAEAPDSTCGKGPGCEEGGPPDAAGAPDADAARSPDAPDADSGVLDADSGQ